MNVLITLLSVLILGAPAKDKHIPEISIGEKAPMAEQPMMDVVTGDEMSLDQLVKPNGLVVVFSSNTCPYVIAWESYYPVISEMGQRFNIGTVLINSNEAFRGEQDTPESMAQKAIDGRYNMPYLIDQNHAVADAFGAKTTPHVFFFDGDMNLIYKGAIDDRYDGGKKDAPEATWLRDAMMAQNQNEPIELKETRQVGCSIKRVKK
ncbi:MAG: redoxin domain-containing protein [Cryomorphaceae bacterium]|nr:redoxin domain-containing protein [Cryomorphaceae bacterium]